MGTISITVGPNKFEATDVEVTEELNVAIGLFQRMIGAEPTQEAIDKLATDVDRENAQTAVVVDANRDV